MKIALADRITTTKQELIHVFSVVKTEAELEQARIKFLGRQGQLATLMDTLKELALEDKKTFGPQLNDLKKLAEATYNNKKQELLEQKVGSQTEKNHNFDVTISRLQQLRGTLHPQTQVIEHIENVFISMGFEIVDGPEAETDYYNFEALNIPADHPARDMYDTFWLNIPNMLMRTHTSPVQVRAMEEKELPLAIIAPGRVYRHEATDASHDIQFMQTEGLYIGKNVSMSHLFATAKACLQGIFEKKDLKIRIRPGFFPFVEPGVEIDMSCPFCKHGCSVCKRTTWIEVFPAGLIHPNVLQSSGIDPKIYSGFAFGFGLTRLTMIKYGINDIRLLSGGKISFLDQF
jgi:phenylalanyl-tRNA synthetase alpha chain